MRMPACACDGRSNECARVHAMTRSFSAGFLFRIYSRRDRGCRDCRAELNKVHLAQNIIHPSRLESIPGRVVTSELVTRVRERSRARHALHGSRRDIVQFREGERERRNFIKQKREFSCNSRCGIVWTFRKDSRSREFEIRSKLQSERRAKQC